MFVFLSILDIFVLTAAEQSILGQFLIGLNLGNQNLRSARNSHSAKFRVRASSQWDTVLCLDCIRVSAHASAVNMPWTSGGWRGWGPGATCQSGGGHRRHWLCLGCVLRLGKKAKWFVNWIQIWGLGRGWGLILRVPIKTPVMHKNMEFYYAFPEPCNFDKYL